MEVDPVVEMVIVRQEDGPALQSPASYRDQYVDAGVGKENRQEGR